MPLHLRRERSHILPSALPLELRLGRRRQKIMNFLCRWFGHQWRVAPAWSVNDALVDRCDRCRSVKDHWLT